MEDLKKVIVVEDDIFFQEMFSRVLSNKVELLQAFTIKEAEKLFAENPDVSVIVMDACVPGSKPTTLPLVQKIRQTFSGPIIAASSLPEFRKELLIAGCNHECEKIDIPRMVLKIIGTT